MSMLSNVKLAEKVYEVQLLNQKVKFRPFTVKEEKNILISMQDSNDQQLLQLKQTLVACTFDKVDLDSLASAEVEMLFVAIRNKSLGETLDIIATCDHCNGKNEKTLDLEKVQLVKPPKIDPEIQLEPNLWVVMKYPSLDASYKMTEKQTDDAVIEMIASCMVSVIDKENQIDCSEEKMTDRIEFIEGLSHAHLEMINKFLQSAPTVTFKDSYDCKHCGKSNIISIEGLQSFFV